MGTRADFYVGLGLDAEWIGSLAYDAYPDGIPKDILGAKTAGAFRALIEDELEDREDATRPESGWPWPWSDSHTTDYAYAFSDGKVMASCFGSAWFDPLKEQPEDEDGKAVAVFPDMTSKRKLAAPGSKRSGVMVLGMGRK